MSREPPGLTILLIAYDYSPVIVFDSSFSLASHFNNAPNSDSYISLSLSFFLFFFSPQAIIFITSFSYIMSVL